jgi:quinol monooxygenase YgiN
MMIEQLTIRAPRGKRQQVADAIFSLLGPTEVKPGCMKCQLLQSWHDPDRLVLQSSWKTPEDLTSHLQSDNYKRLLLLMELSPVAPILEFWTVQEVGGLELVQTARAQSA